MKLLPRICCLVALILISYIAGSWNSRRSGAGSNLSATHALYYRCPMHPSFGSDKPGTSPCCGMQLEPVEAQSGEDPLSSGRILISYEKQQIMGVKTEKVAMAAPSSVIKVLGRVVLDETRVFRVAPPIDGLLRMVAPVATGDFVSKGMLVASFLNREILRPQQAYIQAWNTLDNYKSSKQDGQAESAESLIQAGAENLEYLGIGEAQIQVIARTRKATAEAEIRAPASGLLIFRNAYQGARFERGTELFRIADISRIWVIADLFENEAHLVRNVTSAAVRYQDRVFSASISKSPPQFDAMTRTLKLRLELDNPALLLRPDMFVDVEFKPILSPVITVPDDALIDSGRNKLVYIDCGNGCFEPRPVETGWEMGGRLQIVKGLAEGEKVVVSGTFLLDSESRLRQANTALPQHEYADSPAQPGTKAVDIVCGMELDIGRSARHSEYMGKTYYFCSEQCMRAFRENPRRRLAP